MSLLETAWEEFPKRRGKVRDIYDLGDRLLLVATDRISAYDWVLPNGIPGKGEILTGLSVFWFDHIDVDHHMISTDLRDAGLDPLSGNGKAWGGRAMVVRKADVVPVECVVRGDKSGSAWR
ncbi:MAG: phosphoribosylaminoimidazolesuccinocarboxamide synthase, partial [Singulisphaera sp.]